MESAILSNVDGNPASSPERECPYCLEGTCEYSAFLTSRSRRRRHRKAATLHVVGWVAGQFSNPVLRLRFLRTVMAPEPLPLKSRLLIALPAVFLLFTMPVSAPKARVANETAGHAVAVNPGWA